MGGVFIEKLSGEFWPEVIVCLRHGLVLKYFEGRKEDQHREGQWKCHQQWMQCMIEIRVSHHLVVNDYGGRIGSI
jgi:hypothetical protein